MSTFLDIPIDCIDAPTSNPRFKAEDLSELMRSIQEVGILEPLIVVASQANRVRLVAGLRRYTSAVRLGLSKVPCIVHAGLNARQELAISLVENLHRKDMSPVECGEAFTKLGRTGMTQKQIGQMVGVSDYTISTCVTIATRLCLEARAAAHQGTITKQQALDMTKFPAPTQRRMLQSIVTGRENDLAHKSLHPERRPGRQAGKAETCLRAAIAAIHAHDRTLAIDMTEGALEALRVRAALEAAS